MTDHQQPRDLFARQIADQCAMGDQCDARPVAVGIARAKDEPELVLIWTCNEHLDQLAAYLDEQGIDPARHTFEIKPTCTVKGPHGTPCGAAGDYLLVRDDVEAVCSVCKRHLDQNNPRLRHADQS